MYGMLCKAVQDVVVASGGVPAWADVCRLAECDGHFESMVQYPDEFAARLFQSAASVLGIAGAEFMERVGEHWIQYTASAGYGDLLDALGSSLFEALHNLDSLHTRVGLSFPELMPPSFTCREVTGVHVLLDYRSTRRGLAPLVMGLVRGLASRYGVDVDVVHITDVVRADGHEVFSVRYRG